MFANNRSVCSEAGVAKVLMGYKLLLASYVGGSGGGDHWRGIVLRSCLMLEFHCVWFVW